MVRNLQIKCSGASEPIVLLNYSWKYKDLLPNFLDAGTKQKPLPNIPHYHVINKHQDVLVWDIEDNFEFQVKGIRNVEITSDQVRDNIDKVKKLLNKSPYAWSQFWCTAIKFVPFSEGELLL